MSGEIVSWSELKKADKEHEEAEKLKSWGIFYFLPVPNFNQEVPAVMLMPKRLKASSLSEALEESKAIGMSGIICEQVVRTHN